MTQAQDPIRAAAVAAQEAAAAAQEAAAARAAQKAATDEAKAAKKAERDAAKLLKEQEKIARQQAAAQRKLIADAKKEAKAAGKTEREPHVSSNGVTRPRNGSKTALIWNLADMLSADKGAPVEISPLLAGCKAMSSASIAAYMGVEDNGLFSLPEATVRTQFAAWRKFHGVAGRTKTVASAAAAAPGAAGGEAAPEVPEVPE